MRIRIGDPSPSDPPPGLVQRIQMIIIFSVIVGFVVCGLVLDGFSDSVRIAIGIGIALVAAYSIYKISLRPDPPHSKRGRIRSTDSYPTFFTSWGDSDTRSLSGRTDDDESSSSIGLNSSNDNSPSYDTDSSFDNRSSNDGGSSND